MVSKDSPVIPVRINVYDVSSFIFLSIFCWLEVHGVFLVLIYFYGVIFRIKSLKIPPASVLLLEAAGVCACIISITN